MLHFIFTRKYMSFFLTVLGLLTVPATGFAQSYDSEDTPEVERILKNQRNQSVFESLKQKHNQEFRRNGGWGGGHLIMRSSSEKPILLDFFTSQPGFQESIYSNPPLLQTGEMKYAGYQTIKVQDIPAYRQAQEILNKWQSKSPALINMIKLALDKLEINYIWRSVPLAAAETYYLPAQLKVLYPNGILIPVVAYHKEFGMIISAPYWNQLGDLSQNGMLIHEAFRRIQMSYMLHVSPIKLQLLTATIVLRSPEENIELESTDYLDSKLLAEMARIAQSKFAPAETKSGLCGNIRPVFQRDDGPFFGNSDAKFAVEMFCSRMDKVKKTLIERSEQLHPEVESFVSENCPLQLKAHKDLSELALKSILMTHVQAGEIKERAMKRSINAEQRFFNDDLFLTNFAVDIMFSEMGFSNMLPITKNPAEAEKLWNQWQVRYCASSAGIDDAGLIAGIRILSIHSEKNKDFISLATKDYVSRRLKNPKMSAPQMQEDIREHIEKGKKNDFKDTLWPDIIGKHIQGRVKHPEFIQILRNLRANEEYLRRNTPAEVVRFNE